MSTEKHLAGIARGGALNLIGSLIAGVSGILITAVVTNNWDTSSAGVLFSATAVFLLLTATALLGTDTGLARFLLNFEARQRWRDTGPLLRLALGPVAAAAMGLGVVLFISAPAVADRIGSSDEGVTVLRVLAVALPLAVAGDACLAATRAYGSMRPTVLVDRLVRGVCQPVLVLAAALYGAGLGGLAVAWAAPYALTAVLAPIALVRLRRSRPAQQRHGAALPARPRKEIRREFWSYTWARGAARIAQVALQRIDILLVAALRSPAEAALYTAATRFVVLGQLGVQAVQQVLQPTLTRLLAAEDTAAMRTVFTTSTTWIIAASWPVYVVAVVAAPIYLSIFGSAYADRAEPVVVVMGIAMLLATAAGPVDVLLLMSGRSRTSLVNNLTALGANIAMNLALVPRFGIVGAAVSWAIALAVRNLLPFLQVHRSMGMTGLSRTSLAVMGLVLTCFGAPMLLLRATSGLAILPFVALIAAETICYLFVLWRWRGPLQLSTLRQAGARRRSATRTLSVEVEGT